MIDKRPLAIVTGGAGLGIGCGVSRMLAIQGWSVLIADRDRSLGVELADSLASNGYSAKFMHVELTDDNCPQQLVRAALEWGGRIDGLVNNAGIGCVGSIEDLTDNQFDETFEVNTRVAFRLVRDAIRHLPSPGGTIVNIASVHGRQPLPGFSVYAATKGAIEALTRGWAVDLGPAGIRVNCVLPGMVDCPQTRQGTAKYVSDVDGYLKRWTENRQLLPELVTNANVGELVAFLLGPKSSGITGQSILIDAGTSLMLTDRD